tara:strand:+ start:10312 stop:10473 length:162 start_codon:yes stop_codon:yes gene_type:complete
MKKKNKKKAKTKFKEKLAIQQFQDQLNDAWYLIEKRKKLKRKELFVTIHEKKG